MDDTLNDSIKSLAEILKEYEDIIEGAKEITAASGDSINDTLNKVVSFYSGSGTTLDGGNLTTPSGTGTASGNTLKVETSSTNKTQESLSQLQSVNSQGNEILSQVRDNTAQSNSYMAQIANNTSDIQKMIADGTLTKVELPDIFGVDNPNLITMLQNNLVPINNAVQNMVNNMPKPEPVEKNVNVTNHYDSLLTVNGDITKETFPGVQEMCEKSFDYTTKKLDYQLRKLR